MYSLKLYKMYFYRNCELMLYKYIYKYICIYIIYICVYGYEMVISYVFKNHWRGEGVWPWAARRGGGGGASVHSREWDPGAKDSLMVNVPMLTAVPTPARLQRCFFCCVTKINFELREKQTKTTWSFKGEPI